MQKGAENIIRALVFEIQGVVQTVLFEQNNIHISQLLVTFVVPLLDVLHNIILAFYNKNIG